MKITTEVKNTIRVLLKCGYTGQQIAEQVGCSLSVIGKIRKELIVEGFDIWHRPGVISRTIMV